VRVGVAVLAAFAVLVTATPAVSASQAELDRARKRANAAALEWTRAESRLESLEAKLAVVQQRRKAALTQLASLETHLRRAAVERFIRGGRRVEADFEVADLNEDVRAAALAEYVAAGNDDAVDAYRASAEDLELAEEQLGSTRKALAAAVEAQRAKARAAAGELRRLQKLEAERIARERAARAAAAKRTGTRPSGGSSGGRTGVIASGEWICPVQGPRAFSNDWGQPRSGGRRHQGTDILAPRGTPVVASVAGFVRHHGSSLGGLSYYLNGVDGHTYFGTHLSGYAASGRVSAGTVVGYVGNSGNARGGPPHLHFEIHPGGGGPVNPYPTLARYC
jgi:murein DD-endopeptidase MepM/ murein hydrolase activator NlpD